MERHYPPGMMPFSLLEEYLEHRSKRDELEERYRQLIEMDIALEQETPDLANRYFEERCSLTRQRRAMLTEYTDRLPIWLHSRCPFCGELLYWKIVPFDLDGDWWHWRDFPVEDRVPSCSHLFCVDGALNLEGHQPTEVQFGTVRMASEVPFVKPRLLELANVMVVY
jgi:hypothetical protein